MIKPPYMPPGRDYSPEPPRPRPDATTPAKHISAAIREKLKDHPEEVRRRVLAVADGRR
jgi:hypothetical protein